MVEYQLDFGFFEKEVNLLKNVLVGYVCICITLFVILCMVEFNILT